MGTNYSIYIPNEDPTQDGKELHIGKSSMGWVFSLHIYPEQGINTLYDWLPLMLNTENVIQDEYGRNVSCQYMLEQITCRGRDEPVEWSDTDWAMNSAELGPKNLVRGIELYGRTHGEGTWDYCNYEFF